MLKWYTSVGGGLYAVSAAGQVTGFGAGQVDDPDKEQREIGDFIPAWESDFAGAIVIDDPIKPEDALSETIRERKQPVRIYNPQPCELAQYAYHNHYAEVTRT